MNDADSTVQVWLLGLNHSGTTIFWKSFRKDQRLRCYDEPLSESVGHWFPQNNPKKTFDEYVDVFRGDTRAFQKIYVPIAPVQELAPELTEDQRAYIRFLFDSHDQVVVDETHMHMKLDEIKKITPEAHVVHVYRKASAFASSHLVPSYKMGGMPIKRLLRAVKNERRIRRFWTSTVLPLGMCRDEVIGQDKDSYFAHLLSKRGYDLNAIYGPHSTAVSRLLAYWHFSFLEIETKGKHLFGDRFISLSFEEFAKEPHDSMKSLYKTMGIKSLDEIDYDDVHPAKAGFFQHDERWVAAAKKSGFTELQIARHL